MLVNQILSVTQRFLKKMNFFPVMINNEFGEFTPLASFSCPKRIIVRLQTLHALRGTSVCWREIQSNEISTNSEEIGTISRT